MNNFLIIFVSQCKCSDACEVWWII